MTLLQKVAGILMSRREMLKDYFLLEITDDGLVASLPLLLKGYVPNIDKLPLFLMRLGPQVTYMPSFELELVVMLI